MFKLEGCKSYTRFLTFSFSIVCYFWELTYIYSIHTYYNYLKKKREIASYTQNFLSFLYYEPIDSLKNLTIVGKSKSHLSINIWYTRLNSNANSLTIITQLFSVTGTITTLKLKIVVFLFGNGYNSLVNYNLYM